MMNNLIYELKGTSIDTIVTELSLTLVVKNGRTKIYQNSDMRMSVDNKVVRILLFRHENVELEDKLDQFFYR